MSKLTNNVFQNTDRFLSSETCRNLHNAINVKHAKHAQMHTFGFVLNERGMRYASSPSVYI